MNIAAGDALKVTTVSKPDIPVLTSLRFFACAMIVALHCQGHFGMPSNIGAALGAGVSFFFVLSGFVLTYRYPSLEGAGYILRFFRARFARLWPANVAAIAFMLWWYTRETTFDADFFARLTLNLLMVQTWIPTAWFSQSLVGPAWSIATEFAFYAAFPFLIFRFGRTWWWKLPLSLACAAVMMVVMMVFGTNDWITLYMHPMSRLFEFVTGMCAALAWERYGHRVRLGVLTGTALELAALLFFAFTITPLWPVDMANPVVFWWQASGHTAIPAALLILAMAKRRGLLSAMLSVAPLVALGEMSYATYLIHVPLMAAFFTFGQQIADVPPHLLGAVYLCVLFTFSLVIYHGIECPLRRVINGKRRNIAAPVTFPSIEALRQSAQRPTQSVSR